MTKGLDHDRGIIFLRIAQNVEKGTGKSRVDNPTVSFNALKIDELQNGMSSNRKSSKLTNLTFKISIFNFILFTEYQFHYNKLW